MSKIERDLWRVTLRQLWLSPSTGITNLRFLLGMRVGGFTTASREPTRRA